MKKIFTTIICGISLLFGSCDAELDMYPHSQVATSTLTGDDVEAFLIGVYSKVQNAPTSSAYVMSDILGGNFIRGGASGLGGYEVMINNILLPENGNIAAQWIGYYSSLYQINNLIEATENLPDSDRKQEILGIAHFFRGYTYYNLVTRWGGVPILEENTREKLPRNSEAETWGFIEKELELAIDLAPSFTHSNYVSSEAAQALLARAKLAQEKNEEAAELAEGLITDGRFHLDDFSKIFRNEDNAEEIFTFANLTEESSINLSTMFYTYAHTVNGSYNYKPSDEVMGLYNDEDKRKDITIDVYEGLEVINKYPSGQSGTDPLVITRLGEMYLISAEAQGLDGLDRLNELREARGLPAINPTTEGAYMEAVLLERRRELVAEGFRWYDMIRLGRAQEEIGLTPTQLKLPIPTREIGLNNLLEQNPGY